MFNQKQFKLLCYLAFFFNIAANAQHRHNDHNYDYTRSSQSAYQQQQQIAYNNLLQQQSNKINEYNKLINMPQINNYQVEWANATAHNWQRRIKQTMLARNHLWSGVPIVVASDDDYGQQAHKQLQWSDQSQQQPYALESSSSYQPHYNYGFEQSHIQVQQQQQQQRPFQSAVDEQFRNKNFYDLNQQQAHEQLQQNIYNRLPTPWPLSNYQHQHLPTYDILPQGFDATANRQWPQASTAAGYVNSRARTYQRTTNAVELAQHFANYVRKYPKRLQPKF